MRISFFTVSMEVGGAERVFATLANRFAMLGHAVEIVLMKPHGELRKELCPEVRLVDLKTYRILRTIIPLACYLRRTRPDALLSTLSQPNMVAIIARWLARTPTRVVVREANTPTREFAHATLWKDRIVPALIGRLYHAADAVVAVSRGVQQDLLRLTGLPESHVPCLYNPVITERLRQLRDAPFQHPWFEAGAPPVVLAVGRLTPQKDYPTLLRAFAQVRQSHPARLLILGEGELRHDLWRLAQELHLTDAVAMPGYEPNPFAYMRRASVFVLSSRYEGLPNALIQAMACGCPVVSTDCPSGPREILDGGRYGHLVPVGEVDALANTIIEVLSGGGKTVPPEWLQQFEESYVVEQYLSLLRGDF